MTGRQRDCLFKTAHCAGMVSLRFERAALGVPCGMKSVVQTNGRLITGDGFFQFPLTVAPTGLLESLRRSHAGVLTTFKMEGRPLSWKHILNHRNRDRNRREASAQ